MEEEEKARQEEEIAKLKDKIREIDEEEQE